MARIVAISTPVNRTSSGWQRNNLGLCEHYRVNNMIPEKEDEAVPINSILQLQHTSTQLTKHRTQPVLQFIPILQPPRCNLKRLSSSDPDCYVPAIPHRSHIVRGERRGWMRSRGSNGGCLIRWVISFQAYIVGQYMPYTDVTAANLTATKCQ